MTLAAERDQALDLHAALDALIDELPADNSPSCDQAIAWLRDAQRTLSTFAGDPRNSRKRAAARAVVTYLNAATATAQASDAG